MRKEQGKKNFDFVSLHKAKIKLHKAKNPLVPIDHKKGQI